MFIRYAFTVGGAHEVCTKAETDSQSCFDRRTDGGQQADETVPGKDVRPDCRSLHVRIH